jgi:hypothetical protein
MDRVTVTALGKQARAAIDGAEHAQAEVQRWQLKAGQTLIEAKDRLDHGQWLPFLKKNNIKERIAQQYIAYSNEAALTERARARHFAKRAKTRAPVDLQTEPKQDDDCDAGIDSTTHAALAPTAIPEPDTDQFILSAKKRKERWEQIVGKLVDDTLALPLGPQDWDWQFPNWHLYRPSAKLLARLRRAQAIWECLDDFIRYNDEKDYDAYCKKFGSLGSIEFNPATMAMIRQSLATGEDHLTDDRKRYEEWEKWDGQREARIAERESKPLAAEDEPEPGPKKSASQRGTVH